MKIKAKRKNKIIKEPILLVLMCTFLMNIGFAAFIIPGSTIKGFDKEINANDFDVVEFIPGIYHKRNSEHLIEFNLDENNNTILTKDTIGFDFYINRSEFETHYNSLLDEYIALQDIEDPTLKEEKIKKIEERNTINIQAKYTENLKGLISSGETYFCFKNIEDFVFESFEVSSQRVNKYFQITSKFNVFSYDNFDILDFINNYKYEIEPGYSLLEFNIKMKLTGEFNIRNFNNAAFYFTYNMGEK